MGAWFSRRVQPGIGVSLDHSLLLVHLPADTGENRKQTVGLFPSSRGQRQGHPVGGAFDTLCISYVVGDLGVHHRDDTTADVGKSIFLIFQPLAFAEGVSGTGERFIAREIALQSQSQQCRKGKIIVERQGGEQAEMFFQSVADAAIDRPVGFIFADPQFTDGRPDITEQSVRPFRF